MHHPLKAHGHRPERALRHHPATVRRRNVKALIVAGTALACLTVTSVLLIRSSGGAGQSHAQFPAGVSTVKPPPLRQSPDGPEPAYELTRRLSPASTVVSDADGKWLATFTDGSRTVALRGVQRTFAEPRTTGASVMHDTWVRVLDRPFDGTVDKDWLARKLTDTSPDQLGMLMQYVDGAPTVKHDNLIIAGNASYGPLKTEGAREEGADFNDYLGVSWHYDNAGDGAKDDKPESRQFNALDCSGYMRMVWGFRSGLPMSLNPAGGTLPRRAVTMESSGPGTMIIRNNGAKSTRLAALQAGDLVFFDASKDDGTDIDHVGVFLGRDSDGRYRFISSRKAADGPTLGDVGGASLLDGSGHYAASFRSARRL